MPAVLLADSCHSARRIAMGYGRSKWVLSPAFWIARPAQLGVFEGEFCKLMFQRANVVLRRRPYWIPIAFNVATLGGEVIQFTGGTVRRQRKNTENVDVFVYPTVVNISPRCLLIKLGASCLPMFCRIRDAIHVWVSFQLFLSIEPVTDELQGETVAGISAT